LHRKTEGKGDPAVTDQAVRFARHLRSAGLDVSPAQTLDFVHCLPLIDVTDHHAVRDAGLAIFVHKQEQIALYERAFDRFWSRAVLNLAGQRDRVDDRRELVWEVDPTQAIHTVEVPENGVDRRDAWSGNEQLRRRDFGGLSEPETAALQQALHSLARQLPIRRSRRRAPALRGRRIDLRSSLRKSVRTGGDPLRLARRRQRLKPRPLLLLCDVSGSMERYARVLLQFAYALTAAHTQVEAFVFATQLTRVSQQLHNGARRQTAQTALDAAMVAARDWGGGTRTGSCLYTLRTRWPQALRRGAVVLLISDGCDRGDITLLAQELASLQRRCHRLIWLNPWLGQEGYQPSVRGMQAALPHIDHLLPIHNLLSLEQLVTILSNIE